MSLTGQALGLGSLSTFALESPFSFQENTRLFQVSKTNSIGSQPADGTNSEGASAPGLDNIWPFELWKPTMAEFDEIDFPKKCRTPEVSSSATFIAEDFR